MTTEEPTRPVVVSPGDDSSPDMQARVLEAVGQAVIATDLTGRVLYWNPAATELYGWSATEAAGRFVNELVGRADDQASDLTEIIATTGTGGTWTGELVVRHRDGAAFPVLLTVTAMRDPSGAMVGLVGVGVDITEQRAAARQLRGTEARFNALVAQGGNLLAVLGHDGELRFASDAVKRMLGIDTDDPLGRSVLEYIHPDDVDRVSEALQIALNSTEATESDEFRIVTKSGEVRWLSGTSRNFFDVQGVDGLVVNVRDITERKRAQDELARMALHDTLTGLANRALLLDRLAQAMLRAERAQERLAVLFVDLDEFKLINSSFGHAAGDRVLEIAAGRISAAARPGDTVARFGSDEFVALCENVSDEVEATEIAARVRAHLAPVIALDGRPEVFMTATVGIALSPAPSADVLIGNADAAMYRGKHRGRDRIEVYGDDLREAVATQLRLRTELRQALERKELRLHYQPIVTVDDAKLVGVEALLRWEHPTEGVLAPEQFMAVAEESGLIVDIGRWVLLEACRQAADWRAAIPELRMAINLSARQLNHPGLDADVAGAMARWSLDPLSVTLEVTETAVMDDPGAALEVMEGLRTLGVQLAIDDFGTGYSSLAQLKRFPVHGLKIDRSFVDGLGVDAADTAIVESVISLAKAFGLTAVAEGVETTEQLGELRRLGCRLAQGYLWSRPVPADRVLDLAAHDRFFSYPTT